MDLHARISQTTGLATFIARLTEDALNDRDALLIRGNPTLLRVGISPSREIQLPETLSYLCEGDIVRINEGAGHIRVVYRRNSPHNVLFFTERCNSRCLMCSQPPREIDDGYLMDEILEAIPLMAKETPELCITGGEPTLLGDRLLEVIEATKHHLPATSLHMLSNARLFRYMHFARRIAAVGHPNFMIGIPLYSDIASKHDFVVQAKGAFDETVRGIMNLARVGQRIEIRFVIHQQTFSRLAHTARFIARNLPFVDQVALMGLEMTGFTKANLEALWIDPIDYQAELREAVEEFRRVRIPVMIYNHQLCLLAKDLWPIARKSISDWKNVYMPECLPCTIKDQCGGFFASAHLRYSRHIAPVEEAATA
ncbi:MAG TPA: His-Xaa-Ser system radical SAM maturase HxsC [Chthoniobacterales bacterium]|nr:His-Xaa-Ser system radical SAM maturase HxsC [Chthoniobacterales bacterium]